MSQPSFLTLDQVSIMRGALCTADKLSLRFEAGKIHAILGPNGAGKSSLMRAIFGELPLCHGSIHYGDQTLHQSPLSAWHEGIGYMPQGDAIDAALTTLEVVLLGQIGRLGFHVSDELLQRAIHIMQQLEIETLAQRPISTLSGGQRQLALFAQVLLGNPSLLLLDEPVSALDLYHTHNLLEQVREKTNQKQLITIVILHDLSLAAHYADRLLLLADGKLHADGHPKEVLKPEIIESLYHVRVECLHGADGLPVIRPLGKVGTL